jgi:hypothetical protein
MESKIVQGICYYNKQKFAQKIENNLKTQFLTLSEVEQSQMDRNLKKFEL